MWNRVERLDGSSTYVIQLPFVFCIRLDNYKTIQFRDKSIVNKLKFESLLANYDWSLLRLEDVNTYVRNFMSKLNSFYIEAFPLKSKTIKIRNVHNPWFSKDLKKLIDAKSQYFNLYRLGFTTASENNRFKNRVKTTISK